MKTNRRNFFQTLGAGAAGIGLASIPLSSCSAPATASEADDDQQLFIGDDIAIAETIYGKVKGFILRGIHQFRGIPYGIIPLEKIALCHQNHQNPGKAFSLQFGGEILHRKSWITVMEMLMHHLSIIGTTTM